MTSAAKNSRQKVSIIGMGRLGTALAIALAETGHPLGSLVARRARRMRSSAAPAIAANRIVSLKDLDELDADGVVIITVPDDQLGNVVAYLSRFQLPKKSRGVVFHTSGALSSTVLRPLSEVGWKIGSIHPLIAVSNSAEGAKALKNAFWCVEGNSEALESGKTIIRELKGRPFSVTSSTKALYHAAAVMASGNLVALFDIALEMLGRCGLSRKQAQRILLPLVASTVENLTRRDPVQALTGTFARGDVQTVEHHLKALSSKEFVVAHELYRLLGRRSVGLALAAGADQEHGEQILQKLKK